MVHPHFQWIFTYQLTWKSTSVDYERCFTASTSILSFSASSYMSGLPEASQLVEWGFRLTVPSTCILHNDVATDLEVAQHSRADLQK